MKHGEALNEVVGRWNSVDMRDDTVENRPRRLALIRLSRPSFIFLRSSPSRSLSLSLFLSRERSRNKLGDSSHSFPGELVFWNSVHSYENVPRDIFLIPLL